MASWKSIHNKASLFEYFKKTDQSWCVGTCCQLYSHYGLCAKGSAWKIISPGLASSTSVVLGLILLKKDFLGRCWRKNSFARLKLWEIMPISGSSPQAHIGYTQCCVENMRLTSLRMTLCSKMRYLRYLLLECPKSKNVELLTPHHLQYKLLSGWLSCESKYVLRAMRIVGQSWRMCILYLDLGGQILSRTRSVVMRDARSWKQLDLQQYAGVQ